MTVFSSLTGKCVLVVGIDWCDVLRAGSIAGGKRNI